MVPQLSLASRQVMKIVPKVLLNIGDGIPDHSRQVLEIAQKVLVDIEDGFLDRSRQVLEIAQKVLVEARRVQRHHGILTQDCLLVPCLEVLSLHLPRPCALEFPQVHQLDFFDSSLELLVVALGFRLEAFSSQTHAHPVQPSLAS